MIQFGIMGLWAVSVDVSSLFIVYEMEGSGGRAYVKLLDVSSRYIIRGPSQEVGLICLIGRRHQPRGSCVYSIAVDVCSHTLLMAILDYKDYVDARTKCIVY